MAENATYPAIVTTSHRGVFYGLMPGETGSYDGKPIVRLTEARMVVYWGADAKSVVGLAA